MNPITKVEIYPQNIVRMCCELPMWSLIHERHEPKIFIIDPTNGKYPELDNYKDIITHHIKTRTKVTITVVNDPDTKVLCFLYV